MNIKDYIQFKFDILCHKKYHLRNYNNRNQAYHRLALLYLLPNIIKHIELAVGITFELQF